MKILKKHIVALSVLVFTSFQLFSSTLSLNGNWLDADNNKMSIMQSDAKFIVSRQAVKMNGNVNGTSVSLSIDQNTAITGTISADNMIITWSNGSQWYREISGPWKNKTGETKNVEQSGNIIRIKKPKGDIEFLGFIKNNGLTIFSKVNNDALTGTLNTSKQITWSDGSVWSK
ncbi:MAG: hypothetical protein ACO3EE_03480 [Flavobacteriales bacterium]